MRDPQRYILPPRRRDDLHPDRQRLERHRHRDDRQADERNRLSEDAKVCPHWQLNSVEHEGLLADQGRRVGRGRGDDHVIAVEQIKHAILIPAAKFLRAVDQGRRHHRARDEAVAHGWIEIVRALAQAIDM